MAASDLSAAYLRGDASAIADPVAHAAYLAVRLPATYAAVGAAFARMPDDLRASLATMLDLGAGPGTAVWAALDRCPHLAAATLVDRSAALLAVATRLASAAATSHQVSLTTRVAQVGHEHHWPHADVVVAAYALAEWPERVRAAAVASAWDAARRVLVLVEPGTPAGFLRIHDARSQLLAAGGHIVAPCPHHEACPMRPRPGGRTVGPGDEWCHFAVRVPRTRRHRRLKGGTLGYEDEKFSYLVVTKAPIAREVGTRVLRHPWIEKGRVALTLCTPERLTREVITRRDPEYRDARRVEWGDWWPHRPVT